MNEEPLQSLTQVMIQAVEHEMQSVLSSREQFSNPFYGMMHYHMGWVDQSFNPLEARDGKRIRPLANLLVIQAAGGTWQQGVPGAAAIELLHNFTLIHDDIQDSSPTRRGKLTLWKIWGANQAINSGDAMFALAHIAMTRLFERGVPSDIVIQAIRRFDQTCVDLTKGQFSDMTFEKEALVSISAYLDMIGGKTAALLAYSTELGALVAGVDPAVVDHYSAFGRELGLAFQVRDDILGIWGDETIIGKSAATDIATRKKSLPVLYGLAQSAHLRELYALANNGDHFVGEVVTILNEVGAREFAEAQETEYAVSAINHLNAAQPQGEAATALRQLTKILLNREA